MSEILITVIVYQLLMLAIGWWASKRNQDSEDFYLGGRNLGPLVASLSASASSSSAWSLLGVSGAHTLTEFIAGPRGDPARLTIMRLGAAVILFSFTF